MTCATAWKTRPRLRHADGRAPRRRHDRDAAALGPADRSARHACTRVAVGSEPDTRERVTSVDLPLLTPERTHRPVMARTICADGNSRRLQGISRESPEKSEPGCKPFIWLVAREPRAAASVDGGPVSSE